MADKSDAATDFDAVSAMGKRMGLKGSALRDYTHKHMTKLGHRAQIQYVDAADDDDDDSSGFFSRGRSRRRSRDDDDDDDEF